MTNDRPLEQTPETATDAPRPDRVTTGASRSLLALIALVALASLGVGIAGTLVALRYWNAVSPVTPIDDAADPPDQATSGMPEMGGNSIGRHPTEANGQTVYLSPARQQLIGVRTAAITERNLDTTIRTVGTLAYDETRVAQMHTKIAGWVEQVSVDFVGKLVRRGQPLFDVYSPELVSTQNEYLLALKGLEQLRGSQFPETRAAAESLVRASRDRLRLWDITDAQIERLENTKEPRRTLTLYSPFDGIVLERNAYPGQYVTPEMMTFKIADLSTIWVLGQIFEYELSMVKLGQAAEIEFPYGQSTRRLTGRITYVYPEVDPMTRRVKVRAEFRNPGLELKPETYVTVVLRASGGTRLAIPQEAVLDNGVKRYAILAHPNGYFAPREIEVDEPVDDFYPVVSGLAAGDTVVTSAQFLIDSETNLQAAMQSMAMAAHGGLAASEKDEIARPPEAPVPNEPEHSQHR
jgi:RND family efflux transporter MFP subunit